MKKNKNIFGQIIILLLVSVAFVLDGWQLGIATFSDIILIAIFFFLLLHYMKNKQFYLLKSQVFLSISIIFLVSSNILLSLFINNFFSSYDGVKSLMKIVVYLSTVILIFNYIRDKKLEEKLLNTLSITAVIISLIGIYITISIYLNGTFPYEFLWKFTRQDAASYIYRGWDSSVIRTRSIFSEPAHLGFYLNSILAFLYFNKFEYKVKKIHIYIITFTILLTFSYSSIIIMLIINLLRYFSWSGFTSILSSKRNVIFLILAVVFLLFFWNNIEKTIIIRTQEILNGGDGSATSRIEGSWSYVNWNHLFLGNGIGNTPTLWNIYAYVLSDLGLISLMFFLILNAWLFYHNPKITIIFLLLNFQKGGYLGAGYWIFILFVFIYAVPDKKNYESLLVFNGVQL